MGQIKSKHEFTRECILGQPGRELYAVALSFDKQAELRYDGGDTVTIGTRSGLIMHPNVPGNKGDYFKRWGIFLGTRGNRFSRNAVVIVRDYIRLQNGKSIKRNRQQGTNPTSWSGDRGPAEASGALRIGDTLYAINGRMIVNKTKNQVVRMVKAIIENDIDPIVLTWKHADGVNQVPWELEQCLAPPAGHYFQATKEWGAKPPEFSSVSI